MSHEHDPKITGVPPRPTEHAVPPVPTAGPSEEAEHVLHHSQNPFDRQVAMTMVVIAALLAGVKVLGERAHNQTLASLTETTDKWAEFQAQKARQHQYQGFAQLLYAQNEPARKHIEEALHKDGKPEGAKEGKDDDRATAVWAHLDPNALPTSESKQIVLWARQVERYFDKAKEIRHEAEALSKRSQEVHHQTFYYDLGELFIELGLVLSSVAILTKRPPFWFASIGVGLLGTVITLIGLLAF